MEAKTLRIVGFLCNWCSYGGADTAGTARLNQPTDLRIIRVPCSGRVDPLFIAKSLIGGADGVLVSGCHPRDCHYSEGNYYARRRLELMKEFLPVLGIDPARFEYTWVSASEGARWRDVVTNFTETIHKLGPAPRFADAAPIDVGRAAAAAPLRALSWDVKQREEVTAGLKEAVKKALPGLDCVIGWEQGYDAAHGTPLFMRTPEDVDRLTVGPLNVQNLANFLPPLKDKKIGIVVKGCDSRSVIELLQEKLIDRGNVTIFGYSCNGTIDIDSLPARFNGRMPEAIAVEGATAKISVDGQVTELPLADVVLGRCRKCVQPDALISDEFIGPKWEGTAESGPNKPLEDMTLPERMSFWKDRISRCIRCYACRNACPMCVCRDQCIAETRDPHWLAQDDSVESKLLFQVIHATHLAGRCTGCGECERACPMQIPVGLLKGRMNDIITELFSYKAGVDIEATPPLLTFQLEEPTIPERH